MKKNLCACGKNWPHVGNHAPRYVRTERYHRWWVYSVWIIAIATVAFGLWVYHDSVRRDTDCKALAFDQLTATVEMVREATR